MARKAEVGIEYFPMNTDIIHNPKVKLVVAEFGSKTTWAVLLPLYCKIYREKGYWMDWFDEDSKLLFAQDECKLELSVLNEVVNGCIRRCLFDKSVFEMFGVLTSDRIQENYFMATARRKSVEFIEEFIVKNDNVNINRENVNIIGLNVDILKKKVDIGTQMYKKKKKEKEKENDDVNTSTYTPDEILSFKNFQDWINTNSPMVGKMKEPFSIEQFIQLKKDFKLEIITDMLIKMHNYKPLLQKNISANLTFRNWAKRDFNFSGSNQEQLNNGPTHQSIAEQKAREILNS